MKIHILEANKQNYQEGRPNNIEWIVMHYTGNKNDTAKNNAIYFHNNVIESSAHYFVDDDDIYQSVNDKDTAYHCGSKTYIHPICRNYNSLGVEMCGHFKDDSIYLSDKTRLNAAHLVNVLIHKYDIPLDHIIRHFDVTGKLCPAYWIDNDGLNDFRQLVKTIDDEKVSIITCCFNSEKYIKETIESVINQTYSNWEMIIVDDGSIDSSRDIINSYSSLDKRIKYFYQDHTSSSSARNLGLKHVKGRYIAILDSDDIWYPDFLEKQLAFMKENKALCVCSGYELIDKNSNSLNIEIIPKKIIKEKDMQVIDYVGNLTGLYDSKKYGIVFFNEDLLSLLDDYFYWYEISKLSPIYGNTLILAKYRINAGSTSFNKFKKFPRYFVLSTKYMKQNIFKASINTFIWSIYGINKYTKIYIKKFLNKLRKG